MQKAWGKRILGDSGVPSVFQKSNMSPIANEKVKNYAIRLIIYILYYQYNYQYFAAYELNT